ncbi:class I SAM-dependent methyltransferase [Nocardia aurantia]|uniref:Ubiquinone/menaquinone biosynthesis C-methyltransferase UbiE n=1 Tax=Nocardia aurantia TaxID=2585199 RepID=A0A7K0DGT8_9NOCA|nr:class I SAM-dependent methyltransferase [Nocardia aurantia]MQY25026.1 Ubiquinone/menaquinone biosynthesis C-methyltransferase UbiE [Nocardia aurantia]
MDTTNRTENAQATLWNGPAGAAWVAARDVVDGALRPFQDLLVDEVAATSGHRVLDVGCGTAATTVAIARRLGDSGHCTGVDISEPMIAGARARAEQAGVTVEFLCADAQSHPFAPESFDTVVSRFGVMFFAQPEAAFANLRGSAAAGAALRCVVWRGPDENPFMTTPERTAAALLPDLRLPDPSAPGRFALADRDRVTSILTGSGWTDVDLRPIDVECSMPEADLNWYISRMGVVGNAVRDVDEPTRDRVVSAVRAALEHFVHGDRVRYPTACWLIGARAA